MQRSAAADDLSDVCAVVATAGTTNAGIIDDLAGAADVAESTAGGSTSTAPTAARACCRAAIRPRYDGIERADSLVMDPHKWWFAPFDSAALLYRDPRLAKAVHTQDASYLDVIHEDDDDFNPSDLAYHLTRRARGLALWFSLAVNGLDAYRDAVEHSLEMARYAAARIDADPDLHLVREPDLSVVLFRRRRLAARRLRGLGRGGCCSSRRRSSPQLVAGRDRRPPGVPAPGDDDRHGRRGAQHLALVALALSDPSLAGRPEACPALQARLRSVVRQCSL